MPTVGRISRGKGGSHFFWITPGMAAFARDHSSCDFLTKFVFRWNLEMTFDVLWETEQMVF